MDPRLQILLGAVLFSTGGAAIKATSLTGWQVASFRSGVAAVALLIMLPAARKHFSWRIVPVAVAYAVTLMLYVLANKLTTAANTIFLQSTAPLYVLFLGPLLLKERLERRDLWFVLAVAVGLTLFFVRPEAPLQTAPDPLTGNILGAAAGVCWALTLLGLRWVARAEPAHGRSAVSAVVLGNVLVFLAGAVWAFPVPDTQPADWLLILYLGIFQIGVAYVFVTAGLGHVTALEASLLILIEPVLNPIWAWIFQAEVPGRLALAGGAIILTATGLRTWRRARSGKHVTAA